MAKMNEDDLLSILQDQEQNSAQFAWGILSQERRAAQREFYRAPYGNEEDGWSSIVTSEVQDTVEWILPDLLDMFLSTEDAVVFDPTEEADAKGAEEATQAVNYVFHKQNNGFMLLYTAFKDALVIKNCAIHWRKETVRSRRKIPVRGASPEMLAMLLQEGDEMLNAEQIAQPMMDPMTGQPAIGMDGQPFMQTIINGTINRPEERQRVKVEAFEPDNLLIQRDWTSPLLDDCPYVARNMEVTWSDLKEMGLTKGIEASDLAASTQPSVGDADDARLGRRGMQDDAFRELNEVETEDESLTRGFLRIEWVLVDFDGDGVAERREIFRLADKILSNEECDEVPIATGSPILVPHRWDGMSIAETMSDLQMLKTEMTRAVVNNTNLSNNPRKTVLTSSDGAPYANIDDILDGRPGVIVRQSQPGALGSDVTPFVGHQTLGVMEYFDQMGEKRTGVSKMQQGIDPNALRTDRTAYEAGQLNNAAKSRIKLIARVMAETVVKPVFRGILRLLTSGDIDPITFRLGKEFVRLDPNEWRDNYDMTANVGLGTGDTEKQIAGLGKIAQMQMGMVQTPMAEMFVTPEQIYKTMAQTVKLLGFKNVGDFLKDPGPAAQLPKPPPPPPDPKIIIEQMRLQDGAQRFQAESQQEFARTQLEDQRKQRELEAQNEMQRQNDERDAQQAMFSEQSKERLALAQMEVGRQNNIDDNRRAIIVARIAHPEGQIEGFDIDGATGDVFEKPDPLAPMMDALGALLEQNNAPKIVLRDDGGNVIGVQSGAQTRQVVRDESGRVVGLQ
jgi:hypothetical protein